MQLFYAVLFAAVYLAIGYRTGRAIVSHRVERYWHRVAAITVGWPVLMALMAMTR